MLVYRSVDDGDSVKRRDESEWDRVRKRGNRAIVPRKCKILGSSVESNQRKRPQMTYDYIRLQTRPRDNTNASTEKAVPLIARDDAHAIHQVDRDKRDTERKGLFSASEKQSANW